MRRPRFVMRTIRNGAVKLYGHTYKPFQEPFLQEHEGCRIAIGLYWYPPTTPDNPSRGFPKNYNGSDDIGLWRCASLWGTESEYRKAGSGADDWGEDLFVRDGKLLWERLDRMEVSR